MSPINSTPELYHPDIHTEPVREEEKIVALKILSSGTRPTIYLLIQYVQHSSWEFYFQYLAMPFGLTNAPAVFQAFVNNVL